MGTENNKRYNAINFLENLVHKRFTIDELQETLSSYFNEDVKIENVSLTRIESGEPDELADYNFMFNLEQKTELYGYFDIYALPTREIKSGGLVWLVTEVGYEFD